MTRRHTLFLVFLLVGLIGLIVSLSLYRKQHSPNNSSNASLESSSEETSSGTFTDSSIRSSSQSPSRLSNRNKVTIKSPSRPAPPSIPDSKLERIAELYGSLTLADYDSKGPHPKEIEILTEGMDTLSAGRYLKTLNMFDFALEYAEKALAENPSSFEALLLRTQLLPSDRADEREAGLRQLLEMHPNSVEALAGLGGMLSTSHPHEAIQHLQQAIEIAPSNSGAYASLGSSYEKLGEYDEALAAYQKAFQIYPGQATGAHIRAIEEGNPIIKPIEQKPQRQLPEESLPEEPSPQAPQEVVAPLIPDSPEGLKRETDFDDERVIEPAKSEGNGAREAQPMEAEFEKLLADYERMIEDELDPSATVKGRIADLERSIESNPNQKEHYLELAEAYQEAGEHEKAAEVYRRARERFRDDEEVQQESESYRESPEREDEDDEER